MTTIKDVTTQQIWDEMVLLAEQRPDFNYAEQPERNIALGSGCGYAGCFNGRTEGEGCLVGQALGRLGLDQDQLLDLDRMGAYNSLACHHDNLEYDSPHAKAIAAAQRLQDEGYSWGDAMQEVNEWAWA